MGEKALQAVEEMPKDQRNQIFEKISYQLLRMGKIDEMINVIYTISKKQNCETTLINIFQALIIRKNEDIALKIVENIEENIKLSALKYKNDLDKWSLKKLEKEISF